MKERFELKFDDKNNLIVYKWSNPIGLPLVVFKFLMDLVNILQDMRILPIF